MKAIRNDTHIPNKKDVEIAKESSRILSALLKKAQSMDLHYIQPKSKDTINIINLPDAALSMLLDILTEMSKGNGVAITPLHSELTTQEAADILNVSRPFIIKQLEEGKIPCKMVGTRRKVLLNDLMEYKDSMYKARMDALDQLTQESQDLDLDY